MARGGYELSVQELIWLTDIPSKPPVFLGIQDHSWLIVPAEVPDELREAERSSGTYRCNIACALKEYVRGMFWIPMPAEDN